MDISLMESASKFSHDPLQRRQIRNTARSLLLPVIQHLKLPVLLLFASIESLFIIQKYNPVFHILNFSHLLLFFTLQYYLSKPSPVYLIDFSCFRPPNFCRVPSSTFLEHVSMIQGFDKGSIEFMSTILEKSGQGQETYLPPSLQYLPPRSSHDDSIQEVHMVLFPIIQNLLCKTNLSPKDIDILIVNCSGLCPVPSLSSILVNNFKMRDDVKSYTLSGMGCSASLIAIDMARNLLKVHEDCNAVIVSTEILTTGWYSGHDRSKLTLNCLFRMGSAAILLSNREDLRSRAKYKLVKTLRTQRAFDDRGYLSAIRDEDSNGITGVTVNRDILQVAGEVIKTSIISLGSSILPVSEKIKFGFSIIRKKLLDKSVEVYVPNFKTVIRHFCLPTSGRAVIKEIARGLRLEEKDIEPALATLHRFGNQSSSSLWYELAYMESKDRVKVRDKVWQLGMGTGPKGTSVVWECVTSVVGESKRGPWADCIHRYPAAAFN